MQTSESRTIFGIVTPEGTIYAGNGFRVDRVDKGIYTVAFESIFNIVPSVNVTEIHPWPMDPSGHGGDTRDNAVIIAITNDRFRVKTGDASGDAQNRAFSFTVIGI